MSIIMDPISSLSTLETSQSTNSLDSKLKTNLSESTDDELMDACKTFESYFTEQMFAAMEKMVPEHEYTSSSSEQLESYYKEQLNEQYANQATEGDGIGIAKMMYEQMKQNYSTQV